MKDKKLQPEDDSLCSYCANKEECSEHHMMCIDFKPMENDNEEDLTDRSDQSA